METFIKIFIIWQAIGFICLFIILYVYFYEKYAVRKPIPHQIENEDFKADILAWLEVDTDYTCADIANGVPSIIAAGLPFPRVNAIMTALVKSCDLTVEKVNGKNVYRLA